MKPSKNPPPCHPALRAAGWHCVDTMSWRNGARLWLVYCRHGDQQILVRGADRTEAWWTAYRQAVAIDRERPPRRLP